MEHQPTGQRFELIQSPYADKRLSSSKLLVVGHLFMGISLSAWLLTKSGTDWQTFLEQPDRLIPLAMMFLAILASVVVSREKHASRVIIDDNGIEYISPLRGVFQRLNPGWRLTWAQIESISVPDKTSTAMSARISVRAAGKTWHLNTLGHWHTVGDTVLPEPQTRRSPFRLISMQKAQRERMQASAIYRALVAAGVPLDAPESRKEFAGNDIMRTSGSRVLVIGTFIFLMYAVIDGMVHTEAYFALPWDEMGLTGIIALTIGLLIAQRQPLNIAEKILIPVLFGAAAAFAAWPGLTRINALGGELHAVEFEQQADYRLVPSEPGVPELHLEKYAYYRNTFPAGTVHTIRVRLGALGLWTWDAAALREEIRGRGEK